MMSEVMTVHYSSTISNNILPVASLLTSLIVVLGEPFASRMSSSTVGMRA